MAKNRFDRPVTSTTLEERQEGVRRIRAKLRPKRREKFDSLTTAQQLAFADKALKQSGKRDKAGAIDWEGLLKFITAIFEMLKPFLFPA